MTDSSIGRIGLALMRYFPHGGKQRTFLRIAKALIARGHEVTAYVQDWQGEQPEGLAVVCLPSRGGSNHRRNELFSRAVAGARSGGTRDVDLLVGFDLMPGLDLYYAGDPCFVARYGERSFLHRIGPRYFGFRTLEASVFGPEAGVDALLISPPEKQRFIDAHGSDPERLHLLPPGLDRARLDRGLEAAPPREDFMASLGLDSKDGMILCVGSSFRTKGFDRALETLAVLPTNLDRFFCLVVVGEGDAEALRKRAKRHGIPARVVCTGPRDDVASFYRHAELLLHPARVENTGTVILEAMHCGLPVVATANCGFAHHLLAANAGLIAPHPFAQHVLDRLVLEALITPQRDDWRRNGPAYIAKTEVEGLIEAAVERIGLRLAEELQSRA